ncbi:MAG: hypothetical protein LBC59_03760 [Chitinispirillales bacterium]|jgi:hypothetical protein|nr:hypothetical protein [Chitinispirillales bacterium]
MAIVLVSIGIASAQFNLPTNARISALAGAHVSDISGVYRYPVLMTGYTDHIQATWGGLDGFVGIKSISDMLSIGVLANQGPMAPEFTEAAVTRLNAYPSLNQPAAAAASYNNEVVIPHLLLGFDLGAVAIGADLFFEYGGYSAESTDTTKYNGSLSTPGFKISGKFDVASAVIMAKFGMGFPSINGEGPAATQKLTSDKGTYIETGAEASISGGGADWVLGLCYTQAGYRFKLGDVSDVDLISRSLLNAYAGVEFNFVETAVAALGYSISRNALTASQPGQSGEPSQTAINYSHNIYAGVENAWEKAWVFDAFQLRGGALYSITANGGENKAPSPALNPSYSQPARHSNVAPVVGIGVSKAFATVDVSLNPGAWGGLFTGPDVAMATATVKF